MRPLRATSTSDRPLQAGERRYRLIGGKGGVGKTTCAASVAVRTARRGRRTLVISTDPAPSLADAFAQPLGATPRAVKGVPGLQAAEVDAPSAFAAWLAPRRHTLERIALRGTWLDDEDVAKLLRLSLPGIDEIAGLLKIVELGEQGRYDRIIVDAAPTGHLLRMMNMPDVLQRVAEAFDHMQAKHRVMVSALRGTWIPDAADALVGDIDREAASMAALLRDGSRTAVSWVTLPEAMSLEESADGIAWLRRQGVLVDTVVVNRLTPPPSRACSWCSARRQVESRAVTALRRSVVRQGTTVVCVPAAAREPRGIASLARLGSALEQVPCTSARAPGARLRPAIATISARGADVGPPIITPATRLVLFGGKGGVGKTTCAAAAAIDAAVRMPSRRVLLLSVDPAHSIGDVLGRRCSDAAAAVPGGPPNLAVRELDAARVFGEIRDRFAAGVEALFRRTSAGGGVEAAYDRQVMQDLLNLAPPGIDELAAIVEVTGQLLPDGTAPGPAGGYDLVVMDTAPTGHALRLLEMPSLLHEWVKATMTIVLKYQPAVSLRSVAPVLLRLSQGLGHLRDLMRDPLRSRFITVTRPAALPRAETIRLLNRLAAVNVSAPALVVNAAGAGTCPRCLTERSVQEKQVAALRNELRQARRLGIRILLAPAEMPPPHAPKALSAWLRRWREIDAVPPPRTQRRAAVR